MKRALVVGINYKGTSSKLNGCINDAHAILEVLGEKKYQVTILTDDTAMKPTRENILSQLLELILSPATTLYFHYSGHGSYLLDDNEDEDDRQDECLVPINYTTNGMIIDDELRGIVSCLRKEQTLFCVLDACHSGTCMDLKYTFVTATPKIGRSYATRGACIMLSGCKDNQTSEDAWEQNQYQGALTWAFKTALEEGCNTYGKLLDCVRTLLKEHKYTQLPLLSSGKSLSLDSKFEL